MKNLISQILVWTLIFSQASFGAGRIQGSDVKSLSEVGAVSSRLIPTDKIFDITNLQQLSTSISGGAIGGSGGSGVNLISSSSGASTGAWAAYQNTAQSTPVTATGGAPFSTFAASADPTVIGPNNFLWTKGAANRQGEGFSYPFSVDPGYRTRVLSIDFYYLIASGTYVSGDMSGYIVDVTNSTVIQPTGCSLIYVVGVAKQHCEFQTSSTGSSYRFAMHVASTSANAYSIRFDEFSISPNTYSNGSALAAYPSYTPTVTGLGTVTGLTVDMFREAGYLVGSATWVNGTTAATLASFSLPPGLSLDPARVTQSTTTAQNSPTCGSYYSTNANNQGSVVAAIGTSTTLLYFAATGVASQLIPQLGNNIMVTGSLATISFRVPILGWGVTQVLSSDTDTRVVSFSGTKGSTQAVTASVTNVTFTSAKDSNGSWNGTDTYTVPVPGDYDVGANYADNGTNSPNLVVYVNGASARVLPSAISGNYGGGTVLVPNLKAGDLITLRCPQSTTLGAFGNISIRRLSGPAQIAASEKIYLQYTGNAGTALTANVTNIDFATKVIDSHGAWNGTTFTAPRPGWYEVKGSLNFSASANRDYYLAINGVLKYNMNVATSAATSFIVGGSYLNAGDTLTIRSDSAGTLANATTLHWISITSQ